MGHRFKHMPSSIFLLDKAIVAKLLIIGHHIWLIWIACILSGQAPDIIGYIDF